MSGSTPSGSSGGGGGATLYTTLNPINSTIGDYSQPSSSSSSSIATPVTSGQTQLTYTASCYADYNRVLWDIPSSMNGKKIYTAGIKTAKNNNSTWNWTLGMRLISSSGTTKGTFQRTHNKNSIPTEFGGMNGSTMSFVYWEVDTSDSTVGFECATGDQLQMYHISGSGNSIVYSPACAYNHTIDDQIQYIAGHVNDNVTTSSSVCRTQAEVNPNISVGLGSSKEISGCAVYLDSGNTETIIEIQTSPNNSTWTTKRTILASKMTANQWNFIALNNVTSEYMRIYGNSGTSKVLSITEFKYLVGSLNDNHGHVTIDPSDSSLGLNGLSE